MKNRYFPVKLINLLLILALIGVYQFTALGRASQEAAALEEAKAYAAEQKAAAGAEPVYNDGVYSGSAQGYGGAVSVEVTIGSDMITDITAVSHSGEGDAYWDMAKDMIPQMIEAQSPDVDSVTGATFTSAGIHNAVTLALQSALRDGGGE